MRYAIRRTQKQAEQERVANDSQTKAPYSVIQPPSEAKAVADMDRSELQALAKERGISGRQTTEALREALS